MALDGCILLRTSVAAQCKSQTCTCYVRIKMWSLISSKETVTCHSCMVKKWVFDAALMSTILYGSESWLAAMQYSLRAVKTANPADSNRHVRSCLKKLVGVRKTISYRLAIKTKDNQYAFKKRPPYPDLHFIILVYACTHACKEVAQAFMYHTRIEHL